MSSLVIAALKASYEEELAKERAQQDKMRLALLSAEAHVHRLELISTNKQHVAAAKDWTWNNRELLRELKGDG